MNDFRIFIVEDEAIVAGDIAETLKGFGYDVTGIAKSGEIALEKIRETNTDLVLMDINLAGKMDGIETAGELHKSCDIPVIYLTAFSDTILYDRAKRTGPYGYLIKPYDERELKAVIEMARYKHELDKILIESEEKYRALTEGTPDILYSTDITGNISYISPQVKKYGFAETELLGKPLSLLIHPDDVRRFEDTRSRERKSGTRFVSRFRVLDKGDLTHWFEEISFLRFDVSGKPAGIYGILRDISERKRAEDAIELANRKLNLMNNITRHDILNTITGLLGCVDMAQEAATQEERKGLLNDIRNQTRLIQKQVIFTKEYQEVGVHVPEWQNVTVVIARVLQNFENPTSPTMLTNLDNVEIYADPMLEKVFYHLVDYAIRYGTTITTIRFFTQVTDNGLLIICEDDGKGIPPEAKARIFERGEGKSTGLGLFLMREILGITEITITETGIYPEGARFEIHVPRGTFRYAR